MKAQPLKRSETFAVALFGIMTAAIVLPGLVLVAVSVLSTGSIELSHTF